MSDCCSKCSTEELTCRGCAEDEIGDLRAQLHKAKCEAIVQCNIAMTAQDDRDFWKTERLRCQRNYNMVCAERDAVREAAGNEVLDWQHQAAQAEDVARTAEKDFHETQGLLRRAAGILADIAEEGIVRLAMMAELEALLRDLATEGWLASREEDDA